MVENDISDLESLLFYSLMDQAPTCDYLERNQYIAERIMRQPRTLSQKIYDFFLPGHNLLSTSISRASYVLMIKKQRSEN